MKLIESNGYSTSAGKWGFLDPRLVTRFWEVHYSDEYTGRFKCFWLKRNALKFMNTKKGYPYVSLVNSFTHQCWYLEKESSNE